MTKLTVVIIEYYCLEDVANAIKSIDKHLGGVDYEILVVSNSEYDDDGVEHIIKSLPTAKVLINPSNSGYAGGVNRALEAVTSPYMFLLNPDGQFGNNGINVLLDYMDKNPDVAIVGPKVIDENGIVQPSCRRFPRPYTFLLSRSFLKRLPGAASERARYFMEEFDRLDRLQVDWVSGGAMLIRLKAIEKISKMDERYFLYMEDVDWCKTASKKNLKVEYDPRAVIIHAGKHDSINKGMRGIVNQTTRWHLTSLLKYFLKWGNK